jgi:HAD superfamily hydrolase (TIGR01509 family)
MIHKRTIAAVIFDMDGVLIDSEDIWERVRRAYIPLHGGTYKEEITNAVMGMSALEWSEYLRVTTGLNRTAKQINDDIVELLAASYRTELPVFPGAVEAVRRLAEHVPLAIASSSSRSLIDLVIRLAGLEDAFTTTVSAEEVRGGKPLPDVYLRAAEKLGFPANACGAVEDSSNGIRAAQAAGCYVVALPHPRFPVAPDALALADITLSGIASVTPAVFGLDRPR